MSLTSTVPAGVPSLFHSSRPCTASPAWKYTVSPIFTRPLGYEPRSPPWMSATSVVAAVVPSLLHSSTPWPPTPWRIRPPIRRRSGRRERAADRWEGEDREAEGVRPRPPDLVRDRAGIHHEDG